MFDQWVAAAEGTVAAAAAGAWARVENAACAHRLAAMVDMLEARLAADGSAEREQWCLDNWEAVAAEIGAAQNVSAGVASHQLLVAPSSGPHPAARPTPPTPVAGSCFPPCADPPHRPPSQPRPHPNPAEA
jgi:hypothetical protein